MKLHFSTAAFAVVTLLVGCSLPAVAQAPATPPPAAPTVPATPPAVPNNITGAVTAVDTTANTITIHDRRTDSDVAVAVNSNTKYMKMTNVGVTGLVTGNIVMVASRDPITAGETTINAFRLTIVPELPKARPNADATPRYIAGTVTTTTPTLTITTADNTVVTVTTTPETQVLQAAPGTMADVTVGLRVRATGKSDGATLTADMIAIQPPRATRPAAQ